jgi:puromycin-sensitive aminopeptidase
MSEKKPFERLPKVVKPKHYDLFLQPDLQAFTFNGNTKISLEVKIQNKIKIIKKLMRFFSRRSLQQLTGSY